MARLNKFPIIPLGISLGVAGANGFVASNDLDNGNVTLGKQKSLWVKLGAIGVGLAGEFMGGSMDWTEPLMFTGAALLANEVAFRFAQQSSKGTGAVPAQGYRAFVPPAPAARAAALSAPRAGYMRRQQSGIL